jgi:hypothetical protein
LDVELRDMFVRISLSVVLGQLWRFLESWRKRCLEDFKGQGAVAFIFVASIGLVVEVPMVAGRRSGGAAPPPELGKGRASLSSPTGFTTGCDFSAESVEHVGAPPVFGRHRRGFAPGRRGSPFSGVKHVSVEALDMAARVASTSDVRTSAKIGPVGGHQPALLLLDKIFLSLDQVLVIPQSVEYLLQVIGGDIELLLFSFKLSFVQQVVIECTYIHFGIGVPEAVHGRQFIARRIVCKQGLAGIPLVAVVEIIIAYRSRKIVDRRNIPVKANPRLV